MSTPDPALGIKCVATIFGLNYDGSRDQGDNGIGAFENPQTGRFYRTANEWVVGVSIPIPFYQETPNLSRADIEHGVVTVTIEDAAGTLYAGLKIVDLGPGAHGYLIKANGQPHLLDRTYGLCALMKSFDDVQLTYWIIKDGVPYNVQGQNTPYISI